MFEADQQNIASVCCDIKQSDFSRLSSMSSGCSFSESPEPCAQRQLSLSIVYRKAQIAEMIFFAKGESLGSFERARAHATSAVSFGFISKSFASTWSVSAFIIISSGSRSLTTLYTKEGGKKKSETYLSGIFMLRLLLPSGRIQMIVDFAFVYR